MLNIPNQTYSECNRLKKSTTHSNSLSINIFIYANFPHYLNGFALNECVSAGWRSVIMFIDLQLRNMNGTKHKSHTHTLTLAQGTEQTLKPRRERFNTFHLTIFSHRDRAKPLSAREQRKREVLADTSPCLFSLTLNVLSSTGVNGQSRYISLSNKSSSSRTLSSRPNTSSSSSSMLPADPSFSISLAAFLSLKFFQDTSVPLLEIYLVCCAMGFLSLSFFLSGRVTCAPQTNIERATCFLSLSHTHRMARLCIHSHTHTHAHTQIGVPPPDCGSVFLVCVNSGCPGLNDGPPFSFINRSLSFVVACFVWLFPLSSID